MDEAFSTLTRSRLMRRVIAILVLGCSSTSSAGRANDWPQWLGPQRDGIWHETGILEKFPPHGPEVVWRVPLGTGYSGPAVSGSHVYVMDRQRATDASGKPV